MISDAFSVSGFFRWNRFDEKTLRQACEAFAGCGTKFLSVDAETVKTLPDNPSRLKRLVAMAKEYGLVFRDAHAPWGAAFDLNELTDEPRLTIHETILPILAESDIQTYTFHIGAPCVYNRSWFGHEDHFRAIAASALERLLKTAEKERITLAVENCFEPSTTAEEAMSLVKQFPSQYLGLCLDCGHANLMEPRKGRIVTDMVNYIQDAWKPGIPRFTPGIAEYMCPEIVTVHVHDNNGLDDLHAPISEQGTIDWNRYASVLSKAPRLISLQSEVEITDESSIRLLPEWMKGLQAPWK